MKQNYHKLHDTINAYIANNIKGHQTHVESSKTYLEFLLENFSSFTLYRMLQFYLRRLIKKLIFTHTQPFAERPYVLSNQKICQHPIFLAQRNNQNKYTVKTIQGIPLR